MRIVDYSYEVREDGSVRVYCSSPLGGERTCVDLSRDQFKRFVLWRDGPGLIQEALPDLTDDQREVLLSGISPEEFDAMYSEDDDAE